MKRRFDRKQLPLITTGFVLLLLFTAGSMIYDGFCSRRVIINLFTDNAVLGITAIGMTFVILSGGIDLSVGAVAALTGTLVATLVSEQHLHPSLAILLALVAGTALGWGMGQLIQRYDLPAFLVTLGGMFFARALAFVVNRESVGIDHPFYAWVQDFQIPLGGKASVGWVGIAFLTMIAFASLASRRTVFGRNIYAVGGSSESAQLMGLPVAGTRVAVYTLSGLCAALAGLTATLYTGSGNPASGLGLELDAISTVVIGGTLLTGGVGSIEGTVVGVLIFGTIRTGLDFDGRLDSSWLRIVIGSLLLGFLLLQRLLIKRSVRLHPS